MMPPGGMVTGTGGVVAKLNSAPEIEITVTLRFKLPVFPTARVRLVLEPSRTPPKFRLAGASITGTAAARVGIDRPTNTHRVEKRRTHTSRLGPRVGTRPEVMGSPRRRPRRTKPSHGEMRFVRKAHSPCQARSMSRLCYVPASAIEPTCRTRRRTD